MAARVFKRRPVDRGIRGRMSQFRRPPQDRTSASVGGERSEAGQYCTENDCRLAKDQKLYIIALKTSFRIHKIRHFRRVVERKSENTVVPGVKGCKA